MEGIKVVVCEIENRGKRRFIIGVDEHISGCTVNKNAANKDTNVTILPDTTVKVTEACADMLCKGWPKEVKLLRKTTKKE